MKVKEIGNATVEYIGGTVACALLALSGGMIVDLVTAPFRLAAALPANIAIASLQATAEMIDGQSPQQYTGTVKEIGYAQLMQTHGTLYWANMELPNGRTMRVHDAPRVIEGKPFANTIIPSAGDLQDRLAWFQFTEPLMPLSSQNQQGLEVGKQYSFSTVGNTLLSAKEKK